MTTQSKKLHIGKVIKQSNIH